MASTSSSGRRKQKHDPFSIFEPPILSFEPPTKKVKSSLPAELFEVFINHRGPDVKTTLALQLYNSLQRAGIPAYLDSEETELGDLLSPTIKNAIFSAAVHIAILSPRYAESARCLAELALMVQSKTRIIPLFYHAEPSDFRYIKNRVADAFSQHEEKGRYPNHDIQQWKECLQNVSGIKGYELNGQNDDLNKLCEDVVSAVTKEKKKRKIPSQVGEYKVGLDDLVKDFHSHCQRNGQMRDRIIGIFGMGGSGKTTLAEDLFKRKQSEFSRSTMLCDVRETYVEGGLTSLQSKLLNDLFPGNDNKFSSIEEGTAYIKDYLEKSSELKFLIVIDDVDDKMQLDALLPTDALNPNSLVIVTTRDEGLLLQAGVRVRYKMKEMNPEHSRQLFCWHAFHRQSCKSGFENLVDSFVEACGGLPFALKVMGGHVFGSDKRYWELQLDDMRARLHKNIKHTLKTRYDALHAKQFDVFINHRVPDVQTTLALQLYNSLKQAGIRAYLYSEETELGDSISSAIKHAILSAPVHIAILSPRYAESPWCLAELALMFQTKAKIIPLFYHADPSDFRHIKNRVADAFSQHEEKGRYPNHDIQRWKECLQKVSAIKGYKPNGKNDDVNKLSKDVVSAVKKELEKTKVLFLARNKVGLDELVEDFERHCQQTKWMKDNIIGILGMGGSGKTTLAKELFNRRGHKFFRSCFLSGVREASVQGDLTSLQSNLFNDLFKQNIRQFSNTGEGIRYIKHGLARSGESKFLIVIDDVDQKSQLDALLPIDTLNSNSLVIITTRDERVLIEAGIRVRYKVKGMDQQQSQQLFCWHAFDKPDHERGYEDLVECFVEECGGLPLSLQVLGDHVLGRSKEDWKLELDEVRKALPSGIKDGLKISYDSLEEEEKQIFMDIACFFTEKDQSTAIRIWNASGWNAEHALQRLRDKCLVEVIKQGCWNEITDEESPTFVFKMHNHLRDLGREMANDGENRRVWGTQEESKSFQVIFEEARKQRYRCFNSILNKSIIYFIGNSETSTTLQWLELNGRESIPSWIPLQDLEGLRIRGRLLPRLWQQTEVPLHLKELVCKFTNCGWMEKAMLRRNWNEFSKSLGMLSRLESLVLQLESQENRKDIVIEWNSFVESVRELNCLKTLGLSGFYINGEIALSSSQVPTDFKLRLEAITLSHVGHTSKISISDLPLKSLKLKHMEDLIEVNLLKVETLNCLELIQCDRLKKVSADDLSKLEMLSVEKCSEIEELPNLRYSLLLERIKITCCEELQNIRGIEQLRWAESITITCCPELHNIRVLENLKGLKYMILSDCGMLSCVSELQELPSEFRVVMGKATTSFPKADEMAGIADPLYEDQELLSESTVVTERSSTSSTKADEMTSIADSSPKFQHLSSESTVVTGKSATSFQEAVEMTRIADALYEFHSREDAYKKLQLLSQKMPQSLSAIILCAMVDGDDYGSKYMLEGRPAQTINLSWAGGKWIYTILVTDRKQIYSAKNFSWMPTSCTIENGYILPVNEGQELEIPSIWKRLTERLYRTGTSSNSSVEDQWLPSYSLRQMKANA